jgi:hypothetical protein
VGRAASDVFDFLRLAGKPLLAEGLRGRMLLLLFAYKNGPNIGLS